MPELLLPRERLLADRLVAHVELALELVDPLLRRVVRRVARARRVVEEERLLGRDRLRVLDELERLVGDVLGEVVALLGRAAAGRPGGCRRRGPGYHWFVSAPRNPYQRSKPRPVGQLRRVDGEVHLVGRAEVPLADHVGVPAALAEDLGEHPVLGRDRAARVREPDRRLGDAGHAVARVVAAGQQARAGRRAERRRVPLRVAHARWRRSGRCSASRSARRSSSSPRSRRRRARCRGRSGAPSGAFGGSNGAQSGSESRMSTLIVPLNGLVI